VVIGDELAARADEQAAQLRQLAGRGADVEVDGSRRGRLGADPGRRGSQADEKSDERRDRLRAWSK
jgi:hypothetical protein